MDLVERHIIKRKNPAYFEIDCASFASKNLYNAILFHTRQALFEGESPIGNWVYQTVKGIGEYQSLPRKVSNQVLMQVNEAWRGYFALVKVYKRGGIPHSPRIPKYLDKTGRNVLRYDVQSFSRKHIRKGYFKPSGLELYISTNKSPKGGRITPKKNGDYVVEIIYEQECLEGDGYLDYNLVAGIDLGIDNIIALASNQQGFQPLVINGRVIKSINQFYNKRKAEMQSKLPNGQHTSKAIVQFSDKRNRRINHLLHTISRRVVNYLYQQQIGTLVIGRNKGWKKKMNMGKRNNQKFATIPFYKLIHMITYKAELLGMRVIETEESYTSKCSFLDLEPVCKHNVYLGRRIKRGLFRSSKCNLINADINGALNIIRKVFPITGIAGIAVSPIRVNFV